MLRETGCLNGVLCTDASKSDEELVALTKNWTIVGQDLLKVVSERERVRESVCEGGGRGDEGVTWWWGRQVGGLHMQEERQTAGWGWEPN